MDAVVEALRARGATVATGVFGATMAVESVNDGPFTVLRRGVRAGHENGPRPAEAGRGPVVPRGGQLFATFRAARAVRAVASAASVGLVAPPRRHRSPCAR